MKRWTNMVIPAKANIKKKLQNCGILNTVLSNEIQHL